MKVTRACASPSTRRDTRAHQTWALRRLRQAGGERGKALGLMLEHFYIRLCIKALKGTDILWKEGFLYHALVLSCDEV